MWFGSQKRARTNACLMTSYVSPELRRIVEERAGNRCEYCLIHEDNTYVGCHVDHIIAEKHGGRTELDNLALACAFCNRAKGTDIASILPERKHWFDYLILEAIAGTVTFVLLPAVSNSNPSPISGSSRSIFCS